MPSKVPSGGNPQEWLRRATSNLARAKAEKPSATLWEDMCFDAQQAAEKAIKAVLIHFQVHFEKTHSIERLIDLLETRGHPVPENLRSAASLTPYASDTRYPFGDESELATQTDLQRAVEIAEAVVRWAEQVVRGKR